MLSYFNDIKKSFKLKHYINYIVIGSVLLLFTTLYYIGALNRSTPSLLTEIGYSIILAVSLNLVVGFLGELSLGHAGFMCIGAFLGTFIGNLLVDSGCPVYLAMIVSLIVGGCVAALFGFVVGIPALRLRGDYLAIVTLAFGEIVGNICKNLPFFGGAKGLESHGFSKIIATARNGKGFPLFIITFIILLLMLAVVQNLIRSKHGRAITAIRDNEIAAKSMGVNVTAYKLLAFIVSAFFAGMAGVIYGFNTTPILYGNFSYNYSIEILVMVVLGGMGSINGSIIAATLIVFVNNFLTSQFGGEMAAIKTLVYALILIVVVIYKNAPNLKKYRDKFSFRVLVELIRTKLGKKKDVSHVADDLGEWDVIPTKIKTDEVLSTDFVLMTFDPDKPDKNGGKEDE